MSRDVSVTFFANTTQTQSMHIMAKRKGDQVNSSETSKKQKLADTEEEQTLGNTSERQTLANSGELKPKKAPSKKQKNDAILAREPEVTEHAMQTRSRSRTPSVAKGSKPASKKRVTKPRPAAEQTIDEEEKPAAHSVGNQEIDQPEGSSATSKPAAAPKKPKKPRRAATGGKKPSSSRGASTETNTTITQPAAAPKVPANPPLSGAVESKITQVLAFQSQLNASSSVLIEDPDNAHHVLVRESTLLGAIMCMRVDWQIGSAEHATVADVQGAITRTFKQAITPGERLTTHYSVDVETRTPFEERIHELVDGRGLENVNLLRVELEQYTLQLEEAAANELLRLVEEVETDDEAVNGEGAADGGEAVDREEAVGGDNASVEEAVADEEAAAAGEAAVDGDEVMNGQDGTLETSNTDVHKAAESAVILPDDLAELGRSGVCPALAKEV